MRRRGALAAAVMVVAVSAGVGVASAPAAYAIKCPGIVKTLNPAASETCAVVGAATAAPPVPTPGMPGSGTSGALDPTPSAGTSLYDRYGYSGLSWQTYDEGTVLDPSNLEATTAAASDTTVGGDLLGAATDIVAFGNGVTKYVEPPTFLKAFDKVIARATLGLTSSVWDVYIPLAVVILGAMTIGRAHRRDVPRMAASVGWAIAVLAVVGYVTLFSVRVGSIADNALTDATESIYASLTGGPADNGTGGTLEVRQVLYPQWLDGELGSSTSAVARKYGPKLYDASGFTWAETAGGTRPPSAAVVKAKATEWRSAASAVKKADPSAYAHLTDHAGGRVGAGGLALFFAFVTTLFRVIAALLVMGALLMIRLAVIATPVVGVIVVNDHFSRLAYDLRDTLVTALVNAAVFSAVSAVNIVVDGVFLSPAFPLWFGVTVVAAFTLALWRWLKPYRKLVAMSGALAGSTARTARDARRTLRRRPSTAERIERVAAPAAVGAGAAIAVEHHAKHVADRDEAAPSPWTRPAMTSDQWTASVARSASEPRPPQWTQDWPWNHPADPRMNEPADPRAKEPVA